MEPFAPDSYAQVLGDLNSRIQAAQLRASITVNRELVLLYHIFDILWLNGRDLMPLPLMERRAILRELTLRVGLGLATTDGFTSKGLSPVSRPIVGHARGPSTTDSSLVPKSPIRSLREEHVIERFQEH